MEWSAPDSIFWFAAGLCSWNLLFFQSFDEDPAAFVLPGFEMFTLCLHVDVIFQFGVGFHGGDAHFGEDIQQTRHQHGVYAFSLEVFADCNEAQISLVVLVQRVQQMQETEREKPASGFAQCLGEGGHGNAECDHFV